MQVTCPSCSEAYFVDVEKIPWDGGQLTCPSCSATWEIYRPLEERRATPRSPSPRAQGKSAHVPASQTCPKCGHTWAPAAATPAQPGPASPAGPKGPSPESRKVVLLVEDQTYFTELAREALGTAYRTITVATKDEAMKVISRGLPDLLILDLSLARGQDGRDLLKAMPEKRFPVLIFTARDESELYGDAWAELQALGADDIVRKTMNVGEELRKKVGEMLA